MDPAILVKIGILTKLTYFLIKIVQYHHFIMLWWIKITVLPNSQSCGNKMNWTMLIVSKFLSINQILIQKVNFDQIVTLLKSFCWYIFYLQAFLDELSIIEHPMPPSGKNFYLNWNFKHLKSFELSWFYL